MNKVILIGRLTSDPELKEIGQSNSMCKYSLAVNRKFSKEGQQDCDFINIVSFGKSAEFSGKYFQKGTSVAVVGELRISSYTDKDGNKRWSTDVVASEQEFAGSKGESRQLGSFPPAPSSKPNVNQQQKQEESTDLLYNMIDVDNEDDLPF
jgi:single-strand DNA-binding protein